MAKRKSMASGYAVAFVRTGTHEESSTSWLILRHPTGFALASDAIRDLAEALHAAAVEAGAVSLSPRISECCKEPAPAGALYCHICGMRRPAANDCEAEAKDDFSGWLGRLNYHEAHEMCGLGVAADGWTIEECPEDLLRIDDDVRAIAVCNIEEIASSLMYDHRLEERQLDWLSGATKRDLKPLLKVVR